jgi:metal-responsive CopG/Arc/MetJ family transcriptional regulator
MRAVVSISFPPDIKRQVESLATKRGISRSDVIREAVKEYLLLTELRNIRKEAMAKVRKATGRDFTDDDIFKLVS